MVGGLGLAIDILGSIPNRSSPRLPDTQFWWVGSCIHGLLLRVGSKGPCLGRFHVIKKILIMLLEVLQVSFPWKSIYMAKVPRNVTFFAWTVVLGRILTVDNLHKHHMRYHLLEVRIILPISQPDLYLLQLLFWSLIIWIIIPLLPCSSVLLCRQECWMMFLKMHHDWRKSLWLTIECFFT